MALWKALELTISKELRRIMVLGDSMIAVRKNFKSKFERGSPIITIMNGIALHFEKFEGISPLHIFRHLNVETTKFSNQGETLRQGILELN